MTVRCNQVRGSRGNRLTCQPEDEPEHGCTDGEAKSHEGQWRDRLDADLDEEVAAAPDDAKREEEQPVRPAMHPAHGVGASVQPSPRLGTVKAPSWFQARQPDRPALRPRTTSTMRLVRRRAIAARASRSRSTPLTRSAMSVPCEVWLMSRWFIPLPLTSPVHAPDLSGSCGPIGLVIRSSPMRGMRTSSAIELFVPLERDDDQSLHHQLEQQLREAVRTGRLGARRRRCRRAAPWLSSWGRARRRRGVLRAARGGGLSRHPTGRQHAGRASARSHPPTRRHAERCGPSSSTTSDPAGRTSGEFPRAAWSGRSAGSSRAPADRFDYLDGRGVPELRDVLSAYLDRVRGTCTSSSDIVVCNGFAQGIQLMARALRETGAVASASRILERALPEGHRRRRASRWCPSPWTRPASGRAARRGSRSTRSS